MSLSSLMPNSKTFSRDFAASIVVFLVAMPLCMGIAVASGVPPEKGLITGMIGGIVVGALAGSPLQVSGPAAGLAVLVYEMVQEHGISALGPILMLAGLIQILAGVFRLGGWFRAISPAVVHGMLAGIGVLIVVGQFHVLFDAKPLSNGLQNIGAIPGRVASLFGGEAGPAIVVGIVTIAVMVGWEKLRPQKLKLVPGALLGVVAGTVLAAAFGMNVTRVSVPESLANAISPPGAGLFSHWADPNVLVTAFAIAFIASAETLLSAAAVDKMHDGPRANYNKELWAQGVGNMLCGFVGSLPMTGVIVRSSANVHAGAKTRLSAMMHGVWMLAFVALLPWLLKTIPMASLAGILVVTGWRLVNLTHVTHLFKHYGVLPAVVWGVTLALVVAEDLLTGVLVGIGLSLLELLPHVKRLRLHVNKKDDHAGHTVALAGSATFVSVPKLTEALERTPHHQPVKLDVSGLSAVDHTCAELIKDWLQRRKASGAAVELHGPAERLALAH